MYKAIARENQFKKFSNNVLAIRNKEKDVKTMKKCFKGWEARYRIWKT